jgi:hypothetical protein
LEQEVVASNPVRASEADYYDFLSDKIAYVHTK